MIKITERAMGKDESKRMMSSASSWSSLSCDGSQIIGIDKATQKTVYFPFADWEVWDIGFLKTKDRFFGRGRPEDRIEPKVNKILSMRLIPRMEWFKQMGFITREKPKSHWGPTGAVLLPPLGGQLHDGKRSWNVIAELNDYQINKMIKESPNWVTRTWSGWGNDSGMAIKNQEINVARQFISKAKEGSEKFSNKKYREENNL
tara:strand:- start:90 stop:698 length:609 start_codon:yes stop_codon:yes gene_type:complete